MEIVIFRKQGFAHRFCRELADSIANTWVWAQGSKPKACPLPSHTLVDPFGVGGFLGPLQTLSVGTPQICSTSTFYFLR